MIPARLAPFLFGFILSGFMSLVISGIATFRVAGWSTVFAEHWMGAWLPAWLLAFPVVLIAAPITRRMVARLTTQRQSFTKKSG